MFAGVIVRLTDRNLCPSAQDALTLNFNDVAPSAAPVEKCREVASSNAHVSY